MGSQHPEGEIHEAHGPAQVGDRMDPELPRPRVQGGKLQQLRALYR